MPSAHQAFGSHRNGCTPAALESRGSRVGEEPIADCAHDQVERRQLHGKVDDCESADLREATNHPRPPRPRKREPGAAAAGGPDQPGRKDRPKRAPARLEFCLEQVEALPDRRVRAHAVCSRHGRFPSTAPMGRRTERRAMPESSRFNLFAPHFPERGRDRRVLEVPASGRVHPVTRSRARSVLAYRWRWITLRSPGATAVAPEIRPRMGPPPPGGRGVGSTG